MNTMYNTMIQLKKKNEIKKAEMTFITLRGVKRKRIFFFVLVGVVMGLMVDVVYKKITQYH